MPLKPTDDLLKKLGLFYNPSFIKHELTEDPVAARINIHAWVRGDSKCFEKTVFSKEKPEKKSIIINGWYVKTLADETKPRLINSLDALLETGFDIYFPYQNKLVKATDKQSLTRWIDEFEPTHSDEIYQLAAQHDIPYINIALFNTMMQHKILVELDLISDVDMTLFPCLPMDPVKLQSLGVDRNLERDDKFALYFDQDTQFTRLDSKTLPLAQCSEVVFAEESLTTRQINQVLDQIAPLQALSLFFCNAIDFDQLNIVKLKNLLILKLGVSSISIEQLGRILSNTPYLKHIDFSYCENFGDSILNLKNHQFTQLETFNVFSSSLTMSQLAEILAAAPNLKSIDINTCNNLGNSVNNHKLNQLHQLEVFKISSSSLTDDQLTQILGAAPNLKSIYINYCKNIKNTFCNLKPNQLSQLETFDVINNKYFTGGQFATLLEAAPKLKSIVISGCENLDEAVINLKPNQLSQLEKLDLGISPLTRRQFTKILHAAPNLKSISISSKHMDSNIFDNLEPELCSQLEEFRVVNSNLTGIHLTELLAITPNLKSLDIYVLRNLGKSDYSHRFNQLHQLKVLKIRFSPLTSSQFSKFLTVAPNLQSICIGDCENFDGAGLNLKPNQLNQLEDISVINLPLTISQLAEILAATPNLNSLEIKSCNNLDSADLNLKSNQLSQLEKLDVYDSRLTAQQLIEIIKAAPNLKFITITLGLGIDKATYESIKTFYPHITMRCVGSSSTIGASRNTPSVIQPDGKINKHSNPETFIAREFFKGHSQTPSVTQYHLQSYQWIDNATFECYAPIAEQLVDIEAHQESSIQALANTFEQNPDYADDNVFYGQIPLNLFTENAWCQLPALSNQDTLLSYAANCSNFEIKKYSASGYHFIKVKTSTNDGVLSCIVRSRTRLYNVRGTLPPDILDSMQGLEFSANGHLIQNDAYLKLMAHTPEQRRKYLLRFCNFPNAHGQRNIYGNTTKIFNQLIRQRAGVCRHRAQLFCGLATELGLKASYVKNDCHAFVTVATPGESAKTYNLGGAPSHLNTLPMAPVPDEVSAKEATPEPLDMTEDMTKRAHEQVIAPPETLAEDNPFQVWNTHPLPDVTPAQFIATLTQDNVPKRRLLSVANPQTIESIHLDILKYAKNSFFTPSLDDLALQAARVHDGEVELVDSPLATFLKTAADNPKQHYTWFLDWSEATSEHIAHNSIIEDSNRRIKTHPIPDNVNLVIVSTQSALQNRDQDFFSRMDATSLVSNKLPTAELPNMDKRLVTKSDIVLSPLHDWQTTLINEYHIDGQHFDIKPGALVQAAKSKEPKVLRIHNAPWYDAHFRWFMREVQQQHRIFYNGDWLALPETLTLEFVTPEFTFEDLDRPKENIEPVPYILNAATYDHFFKHFRVTAQAGIQPCDSFCETSPVLRLVVTETLSEADWYLLWQEAQQNECQVEIVTIGDATVPAVIKPWVVANKHALSNQDKAQVIITDDIDDASAVFKDAIQINVAAKTRFENLFNHIIREGKHIKSLDKDLLNALRTGSPIVFKGNFSETFIQRCQSLFLERSSLYINGEHITIKNPIVFISDNVESFSGIDYQTHNYQVRNDLSKLAPNLQEQLNTAYLNLSIKPRHSHFMDLPEDKTKHQAWLSDLIQRLTIASGHTTQPDAVTTPEALMQYLDHHPFVFLSSETGEGKSYFIENRIREYDPELTIFHGLEQITQWAQYKGKALLFIDEANLRPEHYHIFESLARGERVIWIDGMRYEIDLHQVVFAGNPNRYGGRFAADLFIRFPYFLEFKGESIENIVAPLLKCFNDEKTSLDMLTHFYNQARNAGLNITPRNAQMMCLRAFIYHNLAGNQSLPEEFCLRYAIYEEIKTLAPHTKSVKEKPVHHQVKTIDEWKNIKTQIRTSFEAESPELSDGNYVWTESRKKTAMAIQTILKIRDLKCQGQCEQAHGINGLVLEGESGVGKSHLMRALLDAEDIPYVYIPNGDPELMEKALLDAFHQGKVVIIDELNSFPNERLLNALLSGTDLDGNKPQQPGFCLLATQNPISYKGRKALFKALSNRLLKLNLDDCDEKELQHILKRKYQIHEKDAEVLTKQYRDARLFAKHKRIRPTPDPRKLFNTAEQKYQKHKKRH